MSPSTALYGSLGLYALLNFFLVPTVRAAWKSDRTLNKIARTGLLAALSVLAQFALVSAITLLALRLLLWGASFGSPATILGVQHLLREVDVLLAAVNVFKGGWTTTIFIFSFLVAGIATYRLSRTQLSERFAEVVRAEADRLRRARTEKSAEWEDLPATPEMKALWGQAQQIATLANSLPVGSGDRAKLEALRSMAIQNLEAVDVARRMKVDIDIERPPASSRAGKVWLFLSSSGFYADLKGAKAFTSVAANVLLAASLLSVTAGQASEALQDRRAKLEDFAVLLSAKESHNNRDQLPRESANSTSPPATENQQLSAAQQEQGVRYLAAAFERSIVADPVWHPITKPDKQEIRNSVQREWTRVAIREELSPDPPSQAAITSLFPADQWKPEAEMAGAYVQSIRTQDSESTLRRTFIADWKRENIKQLKDVGDELRKLGTLEARDYRKLGWSGLHEWALGEVIGAVLDSASPEAKGEFTKELLKASSGGLEESLQTYYKIRFNQFVAGFAQGGLKGAQEAVLSNPIKGGGGLVLSSRALNTMVQQINFKSENELLTQLVHTATKVGTRSADKGSWKHSVELAERVESAPDAIRSLLGAGPDAIAGTFPDYGSYFPLEGETTLQNSLVVSWGGKVDVQKAEKDVSRSASFGDLENYSEVGGVLVGRPPSGAGMAGVNDIDWDINQGSVRFTLQSTNGAHTVLGPFPAATAYQALMYSTDSRPTAVTAITDKITSRDRILLHPALEDTAFGCRVIQADNWIFEAVEPAEKSPATTERKWAEYQVAVYNDVTEQLNGKAQSTGNYSKEVLDAFRAISASPLAMSQFNPAVVSAIDQCIKANDLRRSCPSSHLNSTVTAKRVVANYFVSHLREQTYEPDVNLGFLKQPSSGKDWPFDFFILLPVNDTESWYIRDIQPPIPDQVVHYIEARNLSANLEEMRDFTVLQRLFRTALAGRLDSGFPVESLTQLAHDLKPYVPSRFATPRWGKERKDRDSIERRFADQLNSLLDRKADSTPISKKLAPTFVRMQSCADLIRSTKNPEWITETQWRASCSFRDTPDLRLEDRKYHESFTLADIADEVAAIRQFRSAIIQEGGSELNCPPASPEHEHTVALK